MKLLIVDDKKEDRERVARIAERKGLDIILAENVREGIQKALAERPEAIITDKDMPDGTGNDVAKAVRAAYSANIAGLTGGNPNDFDGSIDIRQSKRISDSEVKEIVDVLLASRNPGEDYVTPEFFRDTLQHYMAVDIRIQGYIVANALIEGKNQVESLRDLEPDFKGEDMDYGLKAPTRKRAEDLITSAEINAEELYKAAQRISAVNKNFREFAEKVQGTMEKIASKRVPELEELREYHRIFAEYCRREI